jgi:hypothetical protein
LYLPGNFRYRRSTYTEHLGKKLMRQLRDIAASVINGLQYPTAEARLDFVHCVTGRSNPSFRQENIVLMDTERLNSFAVTRKLPKAPGRYFAGLNTHLDDYSHQRNRRTQARHDAQCALPSYSFGFNGAAIRENFE